MRSLLAVPVLLLALATGCGGDEPASSSPESASGSASTATAADLPKFCDLLSAEDIGSTVGATVTTETGPFDACEFDQEDARALSGSLGATDVSGNGGYETYQAGTKGVMESPARHDFSGVGDQAYVDLGTVMGGENLQVAGGVLVGDVVYTLNLSQGAGMSEAELVAVSEKLLTLMVDAG